MSEKATAWSAAINTGNHLTKLVLMILAVKATPGQRTSVQTAWLAERCEIEPDELLPLLDELHDTGLLRVLELANDNATLEYALPAAEVMDEIPPDRL